MWIPSRDAVIVGKAKTRKLILIKKNHKKPIFLGENTE
jgi:hypothetical protein